MLGAADKEGKRGREGEGPDEAPGQQRQAWVEGCLGPPALGANQAVLGLLSLGLAREALR